MIPSTTNNAKTFPLLQLPTELQTQVLFSLSPEDRNAWGAVNKTFQALTQRQPLALDADGNPSTCTLQGRTSLCCAEGQLFTCLNQGSQADQRKTHRIQDTFELGTAENCYLKRMPVGQKLRSLDEASPFLDKPGIEIWVLKDELDKPSHILNTYGSKPVFAACSGQQLCALTKDGNMRIWDVATKRCTQEFGEYPIHHPRFVCAEGAIFFSSFNEKIQVRKIETDTVLAPLTGHEEEVLAFTEGDGLVFSGSWDETMIAWDAKTRTRSFTLEGHEGPITSLYFKKGRVFSGCEDGTIKVWDVATRTCLYTLTGHVERINCFAFGHRYLFSGSMDKTIKVWDLATRLCVRTLRGHTDSVDFLACTPEHLVSGSRDTTTKIWNLVPDPQIFSVSAAMKAPSNLNGS